MTDPAPYRRKLAEALARLLVDTADDPVYTRTAAMSVPEASRRIIAVLASEGVVDPEDHRNVVGELKAEAAAHTNTLNARDKAKAEVSRLEAELTELREAAEPFVGRWGRWIKSRSNHATTKTGGRPNEKDYLTVQTHIDRLAAAIRAEIKP